MRVHLAVLVLSWCVLGKAEPPVPSYLPSSYSTTNQHAFSPPSAPSFSYTAPSGFTAPTYSAPSKTYLPKKSYTAPKYSPPSPSYGAPSAHVYEEYSEPANYEYHYNVYDAHHGTDFGHKEARKGDVATGQYMVLLPDGRRQIVDYIADSHGYRPTIRYEGQAKIAHSGGYR